MGRVMKTYYERWKFRHPPSEDFFAVAEEVSGRDLDWFFDQFFKSPDKLDYAVSVVRSKRDQGGLIGLIGEAARESEGRARGR